jgi:hypothetical protein
MSLHTHARLNTAPEISDGAQSSAPRSWSNILQSVRDLKATRKRHGQVQSTNGHDASSASYHQEHDVSSQHRLGRPLPSTYLIHTAVFLGFALPVVLLALICMVPTWYGFQSNIWATDGFSHCNFNGKFTLSDNPTLSLWDPAGFFYITVSWGEMDFSTAKLIDIIWDIVVGRGGQCILAYITFKVSSVYLALAMRKAPVSCDTFAALAFVPPGFIGTFRLAKDLLTNRGWKARLIMAWIVFSYLFVLSFSSFVTAMSGYSSSIEATMPNHDNDQILWSKFKVVSFTIHDAERIGLTSPWLITTGDECVTEGFVNDDDADSDSGNYRLDATQTHDDDNPNNNSTSPISWEYVPTGCTNFWRVVQYVSLNGLNGQMSARSSLIFNGVSHNLTSPSLNISTSYGAPKLQELTQYLDTSEETKPNKKTINSILTPTFSTLWTYDGELFDHSYIDQNATCQYSKWHNWGFSFLFLFITTLLLAIWSVGTYALWVYSILHRDAWDADQRTTGDIYRASITLVDAIRKDLGDEAMTPSMWNSDTRSVIKKGRGHLSMAVGIASPREQDAFDEKLSPIPTPSSTPPLRNNASEDAMDVRLRTHVTHGHMSKFASPTIERTPRFGFAEAEEIEVLNLSVASNSLLPPSPSPNADGDKAKRRPKLSLKQPLAHVNSLHSTPRTAKSMLSPMSIKKLWTPATMSSSDAIASQSPHEQVDITTTLARATSDFAWRNDLGDD